MKNLAITIDRAAAFFAVLGELIAAMAVVCMFVHILTEIFMRAVLSTSTFVLDEFVGYMVAAMIFCAAGGTLRAKSHLRVGLLLDRLDFKARCVAESLALLVLLAIALFIARFYFVSAERAWMRGTVSQTIAAVPLWIPFSLVIFGGINLALQAIARLSLIVSGQIEPKDLLETAQDV